MTAIAGMIDRQLTSGGVVDVDVKDGGGDSGCRGSEKDRGFALADNHGNQGKIDGEAICDEVRSIDENEYGPGVCGKTSNKQNAKLGQKKVTEVDVNAENEENSQIDESVPIVPPKKRKQKKRLTLSKKKSVKKPSKIKSDEEYLGKRKTDFKETSEDEEASEANKKPRMTKVQRNEKVINEYRQRILSEMNAEYSNIKNNDQIPLKPQTIQFNPICKVLPFAKLIRRSLQDRSRKPETMTKDCSYRSMLKGSSTTFTDTVKFTDCSMFPNKYKIEEQDLIEFED